jgi:hypothetical protein
MPKRSATKNRLMVCVRPGVPEVRAIFSPMSALMSDDFPTLERPAKAISGTASVGKSPASGKEPSMFTRPPNWGRGLGPVGGT